MKRKSSLLIILTMMFLISGCVKKSNSDKFMGNEAKNRRVILKELVHVTASGLSGIAFNKEGKIDTSLIRNYISKIRFWKDKSGYFFVIDYKNNNIIANPVDTNLVGKDGTNIKDSKGDFYIKLMSVKARGNGGYADYYMNNPINNKIQLKESYVEMIPNTDFYLGAGQYIGSENFPRSK